MSGPITPLDARFTKFVVEFDAVVLTSATCDKPAEMSFWWKGQKLWFMSLPAIARGDSLNIPMDGSVILSEQ